MNCVVTKRSGERTRLACSGRRPADCLALLSRFAGAVLGRNFQACYQHHINDLIVAIGQINDHFPAGRRQSDEVFMLDWYAATVRYVDQEGTEWLRVQKLADLIDLHLRDPTAASADDKPCHFAAAAITSGKFRLCFVLT